MVCEYCNFIAKNQQALSAHQRGCLVRKNMTKTEVLTDINTELSSSVLAQQPTVLAIDTKVKDNKVKKVKV